MSRSVSREPAEPAGCLSGVSASTATVAATAPAAASARAASASVEPVVSTSSTSRNRRPARLPAATRPPPAFARRASAPSRAWSARSRASRSTRAERMPFRVSNASTGAYPRARIAAGVEGIVHTSSGAVTDASSSAAATAARNARASGAAASVRPPSLKAPMTAATEPAYSSDAQALSDGRSTGLGRGRSEPRHAGQIPRSGAPHPEHATGESTAMASRQAPSRRRRSVGLTRALGRGSGCDIESASQSRRSRDPDDPRSDRHRVSVAVWRRSLLSRSAGRRRVECRRRAPATPRRSGLRACPRPSAL